MGEIEEKVLIVGAGIAGLTAALDLAAIGQGCLVVEKEGRLGGRVINFICKAIEGQCQKCGACLVDDVIARAQESAEIELSTHTTIAGLQKKERGFLARLKTREAEIERYFSAILLSHGFQPFDPGLKPNLGYGKIPNIITGWELELMLRERGEVVRPSDQRRPGALAFVQCVGSRDARIGHPYCSQVCCTYAFRMARQIKTRDPETDITCFYMDLQNVGRDLAVGWSDLKSDIHWIREIPGDFFEADGEQVGVIVETNDHIEELFFDLIILSVGMAPAPDQDVLQGWLNLNIGPEGFLFPQEDSGVFVIGSASGPMSILDSIAHAHASMNELMDYLGYLK